MHEWTESVGRRIDERNRQVQERDRSAQYRADLISERAGLLFARIRDIAKETVADLASKRNLNLGFSENYPSGFTVKNLDFPAIWIEVKLGLRSISFRNKNKHQFGCRAHHSAQADQFGSRRE